MAHATDVIETSALSLEVGGQAIVRDVDLRIRQGEVMGLVGESGAGKTAVALALLGYARRGSSISAGSVEFEGKNMLNARSGELRSLLGRRIGYVPQNPGAALNPALTIRAQIADVLRAHGYAPGTVATRLKELFESVALPTQPEFTRRYPHQLSGGQQQRVAIALALACGPDLVVLDEPTTGLDVTTQAQVIELLRQLRAELGMALLYVSHNLAVVAQIADRVAVMYGGVIVEIGATAEIFGRPRHPYTRMLIDSVPRLDGARGAPVGIAGSAPGRGRYGLGCVFADRCPHRRPQCDDPPSLEPVEVDHLVRCVRWKELATPTAKDRPPVVSGVGQRDPVPLLRVAELSAHYRGRRGQTVVAVDHVSFTMARGECLAIVGESGSGKSTLARCVVGLHHLWEGAIEFDGVPLPHQASRRDRELRRRIQIVFQNPDRSLNPQHTVGKIVGRPSRQLGDMDARSAHRRAIELLEQVRLPAKYAEVYPTELSGGERQRVAIARALAADGDFIVCDEITSALDVSVQASLLELLFSLREQHALSLLFISHDLSVVRAVADRIVVMQNGVLCEEQATDALFARPRVEYTRTLIEAAPRIPDFAEC